MPLLPDNNPKGRKIRGGRGKAPVVRVENAHTFVPLATNFDFLEGAFLQAQRTRRRLLGVAGGACAILAAMSLLGVQANMSASDDTSAEAQALAQDATIAADIAKMDQAEGMPAERIRGHVQARQAVYAKAVTGEVDTARFLTAVRNATPGGVTLTAVDVTGGEAATAPTATPTAAGDGAPQATADGKTVPAGAAARSVTIQATASSFEAIGTWARALSNVPGLNLSGDPTWSGPGDALAVTLTGTLSDAAASPRATKLLTVDAYGLPKSQGGN